MSSIAAQSWLSMARRGWCAGVLIGAMPLAAQSGGSETRIDIVADAEDLYGPPPPMEDCSEEQEAAIISGEIIVCRRKQDQRQFRTGSADDAAARYAAETAYRDAPATPDVAGGGIFRGPATVSGLCLIPPCPPPPALIIDVEALPEPPPGSDADRIARGLPPRGKDDGEIAAAELGLPPVNPAGSAAPAEVP